MDANGILKGASDLEIMLQEAKRARYERAKVEAAAATFNAELQSGYTCIDDSPERHAAAAQAHWDGGWAQSRAAIAAMDCGIAYEIHDDIRYDHFELRDGHRRVAKMLKRERKHSARLAK